MAARAPALAKLTRPKLYDALPRPRLFALLDDAATRPIVWICAPPGAGKSTLVASWLEARKRRHLWYQVDVGDADPATFVHYMRIAAQQIAGKAAAALPLYTSELQQNLARFARGFFRDLFSVLPHPCTVVFDNFHEARPPSEQRAALAQGLEEIPDGLTLVVLSRTEPPPEFARLVASRRIARIDEAELRCNPEEAEAILGGSELARLDLERIHRQSDGWVAALVLLREHLSRHGAALEASLAEGKERIFQYFAGEIFNSAQPDNQRALMLTAIPPSFTQADAVALTGRDDVARLLEYLYRRHLFTDRRRGAQTTYHYHALFREFLLEEMRNRLSPDEQRAANKRAAELLAARGQVSDALATVQGGGRMGGNACADSRERTRLGAPGPRASGVGLDLGAAGGDARERSVARVLGRPRVDLHRPDARAAGTRARARGVQGRRRRARRGARTQHDRHRLLLRVGELRAARSLAARVRAAARRWAGRRRSTPRASSARRRPS